MRKIRLLYAITKLELGGAQKQLLYTISHLDGDFEIWLATQDKGILLRDALAIPGLKVKLIPYLIRPISLFNDIKAFFILYKLIKNERFDIVHTHSSKAGILGRWAAKLAGTPVIIHTIHGFAFYDRQNWLKRKLYVSLERWTAKITTRLIAVSKEIIRKGLKAGIGKKDQYQCIYYGVEKESFLSERNKNVIKKNLGFSGEIVGTISCFKPQKALNDFLKAAAIVQENLPGSTFLIIGDGYLRPSLESLVDRLNLKEKVVFSGWRKDIPDLLATMEIFVLSSLWEGMPISILEAMAAGLPVVATAVDGVREIVLDKETGFLIAPGDYQSLARAILNLLRDKTLSQKMGRKGQEVFLKGPFDPGKMVKDTINLYKAF